MIERITALLGASALLSIACAGAGPPTPVSVGEPVSMGPFTLKVSRMETVPLTESFSRTGEGLGVALFVELSIPEPDPAVANEIEALGEEANRVAQTISNSRFTRKNFDDSELTDRLVELVERRERLEEEVYHSKPRNRLLAGAIRVVEENGEEYRPTGYVIEESYKLQTQFRRGSAEESFLMLASTRELGGYHEGELEQEWVLLFRLPPTARNLTVLIENLSPREGQPRLAAVALGRP